MVSTPARGQLRRRALRPEQLEHEPRFPFRAQASTSPCSRAETPSNRALPTRTTSASSASAASRSELMPIESRARPPAKASAGSARASSRRRREDRARGLRLGRRDELGVRGRRRRQASSGRRRREVLEPARAGARPRRARRARSPCARGSRSARPRGRPRGRRCSSAARRSSCSSRRSESTEWNTSGQAPRRGAPCCAAGGR